MPKLCDMEGVRGGEPEYPFELWRDDKTGRLVVRGTNEGGFACVDIDVADLLTWFGLDVDARDIASAALEHHSRVTKGV